MSNYKVTDAELSSIANAIRTKGGTSDPLVFPSGFVSAIDAISSGGVPPVYGSKTILSNGEYDPTDDGFNAFSHVTVSVPTSGSTPVLVSKSISKNGTYNPSDDDADAYSQVIVSVSGGGGGQQYSDAYCVMDFTKKSTVVSGVTYNSEGAIFSSTSNAIRLEAPSGGVTAYIDVSMMQLSSSSAINRRFLMGTVEKGLVYRTTGNWGFYNGAWENFAETDGSIFDNCTVKLYVDSSNYWHIYKNESLIFEPSTSLQLSMGSSFFFQRAWTIGAQSLAINNAIITGVRLYSGSYTEE